MKGIYLDNSTKARPSPRAISAMLPYLSDMWGAPSSPHHAGNMLFGTMENCYRTIYNFLGASEQDTFILTSSGAEAVNQVYQSVYLGTTRRLAKTHFIVCSTDEAPSLMCVSRLEELGCIGEMLQVDPQGSVNIEDIATLISPSTALVSLSWGNGLTGTLQPVQEIAELCRSKGVLFHIDATHVLGRMYFNLKDIGADYLTFNGEQLHTPTGIGGLLIRKGAPAHPLISGGIEQAALRAGSLNIPALVALAEICKECDEHRDYLGTETARLRNKLESSLMKLVPSTKLFFQNQYRLPHISVAAFPQVVNETLLFLLNKRKIMPCIGGGSFQQLALVMETCSVSSPLAHSCVSFSLSRETNEEDIDATVEAIAQILQQLSKSSLC